MLFRSTGYYENLIQKDILESKHITHVTAAPVRGLATRREQELAEKLALYKDSLSETEIQRLVTDTAQLLEWQEQEEDPELANCLPLLEIDDIKKTVEPFSNVERELSGVPVLYHDVFTNGINYMNLAFGVNDIPAEELPYLGLLVAVLGYMDTENYTYLDLTDEMNLHTGGASIATNTFSLVDQGQSFKAYFEITTKMLYNETSATLGLLAEVLINTKLDDKRRLREIVAEGCAKLRSGIENGGHSAMVARALSYFCEQDYFLQQVKGISFYEFLRKTLSNWEQVADEVVEHLVRMLSHIIRKDRLEINLTSDEEGYIALKEALPSFLQALENVPEGDVMPPWKPYEMSKKNEGYTYAGQVQYLAQCGNYKDAGFAFTGALDVLTTILSLDYLWTNVRVKGGAYGCMCSFSPISGNAYFVSYRDPNLSETAMVYEKAAEYIENILLPERDMTKYIIGTISSKDTPLTPKMKGARARNMYLTGFSLEMLQKERDQILGASQEDIRACAQAIRDFVAQDNLCALGSVSKIRANAGMFSEVKPLI